MSSYLSLLNKCLLVAVIFLPLVCSSCTTGPSRKPRPTTSSYREHTTYDFSTGSYHAVKKGETLWKISKIYNVPVDILKQANKIAGTAINVGDKIFIPAVAGVGSVVAGAGQAAVKTITPAHFQRSYKGQFLWPVKGGGVVTRFGDIQHNVRAKGIDIATELNQPIHASKDGTVSFVSDSVKGYGKMIVIDHASGYQTVYAYNSKNLVAKKQKVKKGDVIAYTGVSSRTQEPGLHFEIRKNHQPLNPESFLK